MVRGETYLPTWGKKVRPDDGSRTRRLLNDDYRVLEEQGYLGRVM